MKIYNSIGVFILLVLLGACLKEDPFFLPFSSFQPVDINDGWKISTPSEEHMDSMALAQIFNDIHKDESYWPLRSLLVFRNNKLVAESYLKDEGDRTAKRAIWSCTKQVVGVLTGIALEQGVINSLDDPISAYLPNELQGHPEKADITIANLLTMRSGINYIEDGSAGDVSQILQGLPENTLQHILSLPMIYEPGQSFNYNSGDPHLLTAAIQNVLGKPVDEWADEVFFSKIGLTNYDWIRYDDYTSGGWGILTTPRELAKVAQCVIDKGNWNGTQVVGSSWVNEIIFPHVLETGSNKDIHFGYLWWINSAHEIQFMQGSGGQFAFLIPGKNLIITGFSEHDTGEDGELDLSRFADEIITKIADVAY